MEAIDGATVEEGDEVTGVPMADISRPPLNWLDEPYMMEPWWWPPDGEKCPWCGCCGNSRKSDWAWSEKEAPVEPKKGARAAAATEADTGSWLDRWLGGAESSLLSVGVAGVESACSDCLSVADSSVADDDPLNFLLTGEVEWASPLVGAAGQVGAVGTTRAMRAQTSGGWDVWVWVGKPTLWAAVG